MRYSIIAALLAASALPAVAQPATARVDARPAAQVQVKQDKGKADNPASTRDRARAAKAQKKGKQLARQKNESQKKAPAT